VLGPLLCDSVAYQRNASPQSAAYFEVQIALATEREASYSYRTLGSDAHLETCAGFYFQSSNGCEMRIGELAAKAGIEVPTIRYYEKLGLLPPSSRAPSGYRLYGTSDLDRLAFIKHNQILGFTLREIGLLKPLHSAVSRLSTVTPAESRELQSIVALLEGKQQDVDGKIAALKKLRREIVNALKRLRSQPSAICPAAAQAGSQR
jgi:MerR family copper efflux transcriptional regulator